MSNISLADRQSYIGASEVASVFDMSPYQTRFELWHIKAGNIENPEPQHDRMLFGQLIEKAIGQAVKEKEGWTVHKVHRYLTHKTVPGMGASLDFEIVCHEDGPGVLETKTVDWLEFQDWPDQKPPIYYQLQLQHQLSVTGRKWGAIAVLIGGNELEIFPYSRHEPSIAKIEKAISEFWVSIKEGEEPDANFERDARAIGLLYRASYGDTLDLRGNNYFTQLCASYQEQSAIEKQASTKRKAIKAEILTLIQHSPLVLTDGFKVTASEVPDIEMKAHTRRGYRHLAITAKEKAQ